MTSKFKIGDENILIQDIINVHKICSYKEYDFILNKEYKYREQINESENKSIIKDYLINSSYMFKIGNIKSLHDNLKISTICTWRQLLSSMAYNEEFIGRYKHSILFMDWRFDCLECKFQEYKEEDYILKDQILNWKFKDLFQLDASNGEYLKKAIEENNPIKWLSFLDDVFNRHADKIRLLQDWFWYSLTMNTDFQKSLTLYWGWSNWKGLITRVLWKILWDKMSYKSLSSLNTRFWINWIKDKYVNICNELTRKDVLDDIFKQITWWDSLTWEQKYKDDLTFKPITKLIFTTNVLWSLYDVWNSIERRLMIFKLNKIFKPIIWFEEEILKEVKEIIIWSIAWAIRLFSRKRFTKVWEVDKFTRDYVRWFDIEYQFIKETYWKEFDNPNFKVARTVLWEDYKKYCSSENLIPNKKIPLYSQIESNWYSRSVKIKWEYYFRFNKDKFDESFYLYNDELDMEFETDWDYYDNIEWEDEHLRKKED